ISRPLTNEMSLFADSDSTICAIATPPGRGGVAMVRLSGKNSEEIIRNSCTFLPEILETHRVYYGHITHENKTIDEVLVSFFAHGRSFTGEKTFEISCHGSPVVAQEILDVLVRFGARIAEAGEFTFRAFMSGRIDLVQAEAVLDLVESESRTASKLALRQLKGSLSTEVESVERELIGVLAHVEANIDFAAEDIEIESSQSLAHRLGEVVSRVGSLLDTYEQGKAIHEGIHVALVGVPNVGKSSLLNALVNEEKAIVTEVEGTTRDVVEGFYEYMGTRFNIFDTAGVRETQDEIESLGIERTLKKIHTSDIKLVVIDALNPVFPTAAGEVSFDAASSLVIVNKCDLKSSDSKSILRQSALEGAEVVEVSAKTGKGLDELKALIADRFGLKGDHNQTALLTNSRHLAALTASKKSLEKGLSLIRDQQSPDFVAFELMEGLKGIQALLGKRFDDEVLDQVFREFCLGK
ncbi:MAG: tRNA uridine-5-carboxymethylaminomethyl(34) synthesis GTPase MnmE, partial [Pseudomonadota bacterium]